MLGLINDPQTYTKLNNDPTNRMQTLANSIMTSWLKNGNINDQT